MVEISLNQLNLHDSEILAIHIKVDAGDPIELVLHYIDDYESMATSMKRLRFCQCWKLVTDMNIGPGGSVDFGEELTDSDLLESQRALFARVGQVFPDRVKHYRIQTSSSGSTIDILAERLEFEDIEP